jgi:pimeloyl-ACP methyl ester carboxylesterase
VTDDEQVNDEEDCEAPPQCVCASCEAPDFVPPNGSKPLDDVVASLSIEFVPCLSAEAAFDSDEASCGFVRVPIFWDDPSAGSIRLMLRRHASETQPAKGSVWFVAGGPGLNSNQDWYTRSVLTAAGYNVYELDHRGTGRSTPLVCPDAIVATEPEYVAICANAMTDIWGDKLEGFSTTEAARDLGELIRAVSGADEKVIVWGHSYGTYLLHRYLALFPSDVDGVVMEGLVGPEGSFHRFNHGLDEAGRAVVAKCADFDACNEKLGGNPVQMLNDMLTKLNDDAYCKTRFDLDKNSYNQMMRAGLLEGYYHTIFPIIHRVNRCNVDDVATIEFMVNNMNFGKAATEAYGRLQGFADALYYNVSYSEMWDWSTSADEIQAANADLAFSSDSLVELRKGLEFWPRYERDEHYGQTGNKEMPMLMFNGTLDPNTPISVAQQVASTYYNGEHQTFLAVPLGGHSVVTSSDCTTGLLTSFLDNPTGSIDAACLDTTGPEAEGVFFTTESDLNTPFWSNSGGEELYEGAPFVTRIAYPGLPEAAATLPLPQASVRASSPAQDGAPQKRFRGTRPLLGSAR